MYISGRFKIVVQTRSVAAGRVFFVPLPGFILFRFRLPQRAVDTDPLAWRGAESTGTVAILRTVIAIVLCH